MRGATSGQGAQPRACPQAVLELGPSRGPAGQSARRWWPPRVLDAERLQESPGAPARALGLGHRFDEVQAGRSRLPGTTHPKSCGTSPSASGCRPSAPRAERRDPAPDRAARRARLRRRPGRTAGRRPPAGWRASAIAEGAAETSKSAPPKSPAMPARATATARVLTTRASGPSFSTAAREAPSTTVQTAKCLGAHLFFSSGLVGGQPARRRAQLRGGVDLAERGDEDVGELALEDRPHVPAEVRRGDDARSRRARAGERGLRAGGERAQELRSRGRPPPPRRCRGGDTEKRPQELQDPASMR